MAKSEQKKLTEDGNSNKTTFTYYNLRLKLLTEQLGTCTEASIYAKHVQEKAKKEIAAANKLTKKLAKYRGVELTETKQVDELKGILRSYMERTGVVHDLPDELDDLLDLSEEIKQEFDEKMKGDKGSQPTVFMRDKDGWPMISTHMILGNLKENLKTITNNGDKTVATSKVAVGEMGSLDIKVVEDFIRPSIDIARDEDGNPKIDERPIKFNRMGHIETAIARSEVLPAGAEYECHLRIRTMSPLNNLTVLSYLLDLGKNCGLGQWRGSGKKGSYAYKIEQIENYKEQLPDGWN